MTRRKSTNALKKIYEDKYKILLIIPFAILILSLVQIGYQTATTGEFISKGVSLKGGVTVTLYGVENNFEDALKDTYEDLEIRTLTSASGGEGIIIEASIPEDEADAFKQKVSELSGVDSQVINMEVMGSALGDSFFRDTIKAIIIAFFLMGGIVFIYFRKFAPSIAIMLAAFSDMVISVACVNLLGIKLSTAGIAAFLMMIGYSVDTDILLSIRVLKRKDGAVMERVYKAVKTGFTMNVTTIVAVLISLIFTQSDVIRQIMIILLIGLIADSMNTWIQNVGILRIYLEMKGIERKSIERKRS